MAAHNACSRHSLHAHCPVTYWHCCTSRRHANFHIHQSAFHDTAPSQKHFDHVACQPCQEAAAGQHCRSIEWQALPAWGAWPLKAALDIGPLLMLKDSLCSPGVSRR
eukprot:GHRQ01010169.1.p2 GENE.GHRQ01010169.1~~GHRQ01010169.1.p2  ORF type:complete len:107 (-),score=6.08 GHRQ01010169.1:295-615(-)